MVPDTSNTLRADLDALEHTNVAVRSMFRSILDGVRDHPTPDPGHAARTCGSSSPHCSAIVAAASRPSVTWPAPKAPTHRVPPRTPLAAALQTLREARDRIDDLQMIDPGADDGWELSEPVRQTVERVLRDLTWPASPAADRPIVPATGSIRWRCSRPLTSCCIPAPGRRGRVRGRYPAGAGSPGNPGRSNRTAPVADRAQAQVSPGRPGHRDRSDSRDVRAERTSEHRARSALLTVGGRGARTRSVGRRSRAAG